jgi:hypothetical protein
MSISMRDPTAETGSQRRPRVAPPPALAGLTVALLDIGKPRGSEYIDRLEARLAERGINAKRYRKPTNTRVAPTQLLQQIATETQVAVVALSD